MVKDAPLSTSSMPKEWFGEASSKVNNGKGKEKANAANTGSSIPNGFRVHTHRVKDGETVFGIAIKYDVSETELRTRNGLRARDTLMFKSELNILLPEGVAAIEEAKDADRGLFGEAATSSATIDVDLNSSTAGAGGSGGGADAGAEEIPLSPPPSKPSVADFFSKFDKSFGAAKASAKTMEDTSAITRESPVYRQGTGAMSMMPHAGALTKAGKLAAEDNALSLIGDLLLGPRLPKFAAQVPDAEDTRSLASNQSPSASTSSRMSPSPSGSYAKLNPAFLTTGDITENELDKDVGVFEL